MNLQAFKEERQSLQGLLHYFSPAILRASALTNASTQSNTTVNRGHKAAISGLKFGCGALLSISLLTSCTAIRDSISNFSSSDPHPPADFTQGLLPVRIATPLYPLKAKNMQIQGWAMVNFSVDGNGNVIQNTIEVTGSEPTGFFERSAAIAARDFVFENNSGDLIEDISYVFRFELEEENRIGRDLSSSLPNERPLVPRRYITPRYPANASSQGIGGHVEVEFTVTPTGGVTDLNILSSEPEGVFEASALDAAQRLLFDPKTVDGEPVAVEKVRYRFDWDPDGRTTATHQ